MDYIKYCKHGQEVVIAAEELLQDSRFSWRERKEKTMKLYELYEKAGYSDYAALMAAPSSLPSTFRMVKVRKMNFA